MYYSSIVPGRFIERPNRFIAYVEIHGQVEVCHVKNTGRCRELLRPGAAVYCQYFSSEKRKTAYDLIAVEKEGRLINMDSQAPNQVFREWVMANGFLGQPAVIWPEYRFGQSRLDFRLDLPEKMQLVEVKGVTLEESGHAFFPDAPTQRGTRHLQELISAAEQGVSAAVFFVIQMSDVLDFGPNDVTDPDFGQALRLAREKGVQVLAYDCRVTPETLQMGTPVPLRF